MIGAIFQAFLLALVYMAGNHLQGFALFDWKVFILIFTPWVFTIWLTHKHRPKYYQSKTKYVLAPFLKAYVVHFVLSLFLLFVFFSDKLILVGTASSLMVYYILEYLIYFVILKVGSRNPQEKKDVVTRKYIQDKLDLSKIEPIILPDLISEKLPFNLQILKELLPDREGKQATWSIDSLDKNELDLVIVGQLVNDIEHTNEFFSRVYKQVKKGGYFVIGYVDLDDIEDQFSKSSGAVRFFRKLKYYSFDRAFPKLPFFRTIHQLFTGGRDKVMSKTEVWGRLMYCGFDVRKETKQGRTTYLLARKDRTPSENPNPSYSPLIKLNRVGLYGNIITIFKVRSMYPYSEFLQEKVYEMNSLTSTGKFSEDFRITKLGKMYRKYWIDELPQFLDWFRGSIKLVGIRAMSQHFFSLYTKEYQDLFYQVKPGIISPIFDEGTDSFANIQKIEQEYLEKYLKSPWKTDVEYFFITVKHILKGVRSK